MSMERVGVWIDHRKATIVMLSGNEHHAVVIASNVEKHPERAGDSPLKGSYEAAQVPADDSRQRTLTSHLNVYYDALVAALRDAELVLIFGPGEAKIELKKRLVKHGLGARIAAVLTAGKMTDRQIVAKIRKYFESGRAI